jgi:hypothetical protein
VRRAVLHAVDALGLVRALILRLPALVLPFKTPVFSESRDLLNHIHAQHVRFESNRREDSSATTRACDVRVHWIVAPQGM